MKIKCLFCFSTICRSQEKSPAHVTGKPLSVATGNHQEIIVVSPPDTLSACFVFAMFVDEKPNSVFVEKGEGFRSSGGF